MITAPTGKAGSIRKLERVSPLSRNSAAKSLVVDAHLERTPDPMHGKVLYYEMRKSHFAHGIRNAELVGVCCKGLTTGVVLTAPISLLWNTTR